jgi:hypothetical protein
MGTRLPPQSTDGSESLSFEVRIEREGLVQVAQAHQNERDRVHEAQLAKTPREEKVEPSLVDVGVDPDHLEKRRELVTKTFHGGKTDTPVEQSIRLEEHVGRRNERRLALLQGTQDLNRLLVMDVLGDEQREESRGIDEDAAQEKASSR